MSDESETRVRFAPSPTGFFHIGSARTALFNWLYARHKHGKFILRIEDTDAERNTEEGLKVLLEGMKWLGMDWDEGPDLGGPCEPYFQSKRQHIYREFIEQLKQRDRVYEKEGALWLHLPGERETVYDAHKQAEVEKVKRDPVVFQDTIRGEITQQVDQDFVIVRSDGSPVFHLVNVVDDIQMNITHVIRGEDHLPNTGKHIELFRALGAEPPVFAHIPLILKADGKGKMSKRDQGALIEEYQRRNYLPDAVRNYIALLGWNPKDDKEYFTIAELIQRFDLPGINSSPAKFDEQKMDHFNTEHLRRMPIANLAWMVAPQLTEAGIPDNQIEEDYLQTVLKLCQEKIKTLESIPSFLGFFFTEDYSIDEKALNKITKKGNPKEKVDELVPVLEAIDPFTESSIDDAVEQTAIQLGRKKYDYFPALRIAITGQSGGPDLLRTLVVLGQERVVSRMKRFSESLQKSDQ